MNFTFLSRRGEKLNFSSKTSKEVLQEEQCILQTHKKQDCHLKLLLSMLTHMFDKLEKSVSFT